MVVCVVGPTASGKSEIADLVAATLGSPVISVDAMQVYRGMDIGTAKVPESERRVPLLMVDVCNVGDDYSVELFQREARSRADDVIASGHVPVLCGGTGLYLDSVIDEMDFPAGRLESESRARYERMADEQGSQALHDHLAERDPESAAIIHPNNVRRVVRALELLDGGKSYAKQHAGLLSRQPHYDARIFGLTMSRERLYERIDRRVDLMFDAGLVEETRGLRDRGLDNAATARQAIGYSECIDLLDGRISLDEAKASTKLRTRRYAKRQLSWLKRDGRAEWLDMDQMDSEGAAAAILASIASAPAERK